MYEDKKIADVKCMRCMMCQERFDLEIDCEDCRYYHEYVKTQLEEEEYEDVEVDIIHVPNELYDEEYEIESCLEAEEEE